LRLSDETLMGGGAKATFLHCNSRHHSIGLGGPPGIKGLHHVMLETNSLDDVGIALDAVNRLGVEITITLGRHFNDGMLSFYMRSPSGFQVEYGWGGTQVGDDWIAMQTSTGELWGHTYLSMTSSTIETA
jgi:extradiol dioxygenase